MNDVLFVILRALRAPLIVLIGVYGISIAGLSFIPGADADGRPGPPMSIFHAFYVMSYTATTIGFGEIPNAFTDTQRLWVTFSIYLSVVGWAYTLGSVFTLVNDRTFRGLLSRGLFMWRVKRIGEPFYILCGYGESGARLARAMDRLGRRLVIIESRPERAALIAIQDYATPPLVVNEDARLPDVLEDAGIRSPECIGVIAVAGADDINQAIGIGARVLNPSIRIVTRAMSHVAKVNLESFGGVEVINPFETFAENLGVALSAPEVLRIEEWLTSAPGSPCPPLVVPPRGRWVLVGFGRFGHTIADALDRAGIEWRAHDPAIADASERRLLRGEYTENLLHEAGIDDAVAIVAGTDNDAVNLGVATLARRVRPDIFVVIRQNSVRDRALVEAARANFEFVQAELMVHECLQLLRTPMLARFIARLREVGNEAAAAAIERVRAETGEGAPQAWVFSCDIMQPGMFTAFLQRNGDPFRISHLVTDPTNPAERMPIAALMLERGGAREILPVAATELKPGDRILFVGDDASSRLQHRYLTEPGTVTWVCSGTEPARGFFFRWLEQRRRARSI